MIVMRSGTRIEAARCALRFLNTLCFKLNILKMQVWLVALNGCKTWILKAIYINNLISFETTNYRQALHISWTDYKTNESVIGEIRKERKLVVIMRK